MPSDLPSAPGQPGAPPPISVGLVLGAGGISGWAWLVGCLAALEEIGGWDARSADLVVGTSAGAGVAAILRGGVSAMDQLARYEATPRPPGKPNPARPPVASRGTEPSAGAGQPATSEEGRPAESPQPPGPPAPPEAAESEPADPDVVVRLADTRRPGRARPRAPHLAVLALRHWPPRPGVALAGLLPRGRHSLDDLGERIHLLHPGAWPTEPLWIAATRADTGRRVVFGRDSVHTDVARAVRASAAVPGWYEPVRIGGRDYLDGGAWSSTNADLVAGLGLDSALVLAPQSISSSRCGWRGEGFRRAYHRSVLSREVDIVHRNGTDTVVVEPHPDDLALLDGPGRDVEPARRLAIAERARERMSERLADDRSLRSALGTLETAP
jgi:NTE family protein